MTSSAIVLAVLGLTLTFAPAETQRYFGATPSAIVSLVLQIAGAAFLGFAFLDWMAKDSVIGGIYNRPLAMGNFLHFFAGACAAVKFVLAYSSGVVTVAIAVIYCVLAAGFAFVAFGSGITSES